MSTILPVLPIVSVIVACVLVQAFFAASEIALVSADELKVQAESESGNSGAKMLGGLLANRDRLLALTLTGNNLATVLAAVALTSFLSHFGLHASYLAPFILAPITLLFGESIPKLLTLKNPLGFARIAARPLRIAAVLIAPVLAAETRLSRALRRLAGVDPDAMSVFMSREDLVRLTHRRAGEGVAPEPDAILPIEQQMIRRIFRFSRADARKAMVPLSRVDAVP
ncbi:MAG TPA: CNNM domain-containing protein, partial [Candidatus Binataceae bacterium]